MELKLLDLNVWLMPKPLSSDNKKRILRLVKLINRLKPDIITLQEVWFIKDEKSLRKQLPAYHTLSSGKKRFNNSGLVTLTKIRPISEKLFSFNKKSWIDKLARKGYLVVRLNLDGQILHILNTHLHASKKSQPNKTTYSQFQQLKEITKKGSWVVAGDLNIRLEQLRRLNAGHFALSRSATPTFSPKNRYARSRLNRFSQADQKIDYVLVRPEKGKKITLRTRVIKSPLLSDHYALLSIIRL